MNIYFQVAGLVIVLYLIFLYFSHRNLRIREEKTFIAILLLTLLNLILDALSVVAIHFRANLPDVLVQISCKSYIISMMWLGMVDFCYVMLDLRKTQKTHIRMITILSCFTAAASVLTALLPIEIHNNGQNVYTAGPAVLSVYAVTLFYITSTLVGAIFIALKKNSRRGQAVIVTTLFWIIAAVVQFFNNEILVVGFASAVGVMILYIVLENPDSNLDRQFGCFNSFALSQHLEQEIIGSKSFHIIDISVKNLQILESQGIDVQEKIKEVIKAIGKERDLLLFKNMSYGLNAVTDNEKTFEAAYSRLEKLKASLGESSEEVLLLKVKNAQKFQNTDQLLKFLTYIRAESQEYECLFHADFDTMKVEQYCISNDLQESVPAWDIKNDYQKCIEVIADLVVEEHREKFLRETAPLFIQKKTKNGTAHFIDMRLNINGEEIWHQMKIIHLDVHESRNCAVIGLRNDDATMRRAIVEQQNKEAIQNISTAISEDYECLFHVDFDSCIEDHYRIGEDFIKAMPGWDKENNYLKRIELLKNIVVPEDLEAFLEAVKPEVVSKKVSGGTTYYVDFRVILEGKIHWYQVKMIHHHAHKGHNCAVVGITNIDEIMENIEKQQRALEEALSMAQSANRAKTTFLNSMSHDIRTPMNAIIGYTGLAASHIDSKELVQEYLAKIEQSSEHLLSLINDILDMSRIESGKMTLNEQKEELSEIVHTIRNITQSSIMSKNLDFYVDVMDVTDELVICDKLRLNQVLLNILSNSIKYTPAGGTISFKVSEHNSSREGYAKYKFTVKDTGIGMSEEFVKTIFEPFTRVESSTVSGIQGTGLGMAITKNIVDMMGGIINIKSEENVGTEVNIELELQIYDTHDENEFPQALKKLTGLRGLVADDDLDSCVSISKMLKNISMRSEWCSSGKEAVFRAQQAHDDADDFSVYIIDWMMPDLNGIETARRIRQVVGDFVPIIIITAYDWADIEEEAHEAGVTAFVNKPLFMTDLKKTLIKCCEPEVENGTEEDKPDYSGKKILLVEDNDMNSEIACEILEEYGFIVDTAEDGTIAVEKMKTVVPGEYDLILMDIQMPIMDGYEATRQIRAIPDPEISGIPIIAMTANAFEEDRQLAFQAGMNEHIAKPIDIDNLITTLGRILEG